MEGWIDNQCREKRKARWRTLKGKLRGKEGSGGGEGKERRQQA